MCCRHQLGCTMALNWTKNVTFGNFEYFKLLFTMRGISNLSKYGILWCLKHSSADIYWSNLRVPEVWIASLITFTAQTTVTIKQRTVCSFIPFRWSQRICRRRNIILFFENYDAIVASQQKTVRCHFLIKATVCPNNLKKSFFAFIFFHWNETNYFHFCSKKFFFEIYFFLFRLSQTGNNLLLASYRIF